MASTTSTAPSAAGTTASAVQASAHLLPDRQNGLVILAVDDEQPALDELEYCLLRDPRVGTVLTASNANDALKIVSTRERIQDPLPNAPTRQLPIHPVTGSPIARTTDIDVVFLDYRMPGLDGIELARVFTTMAAPPAIVITTVYDYRAVDAYEVGAADFLLKPLRPERLHNCLDRIMLGRPGLGAARQEYPEEDEIIPVELAGTTKLVARSAVRYVEAQGDYLRLHTNDGKSHLVRIPISVLEERWREAGFVRIHRSYLVSLAEITALRVAGSGYVVRLGSGPMTVEVPVSRRHTRELKDRLIRATKQAWSQL